MENIKKLMNYVGEYRRYIYYSVFFASCSTLFLFIPYYSIYHLFIQQKQYNASYYGLLAVGSTLVGLLFYYFALWYSHLAGFRVERNMRISGVDRLLTVSLDFFDQNESGKVRKTIDDNAAITHSFVAHNLPDLVNTVISPVIILSVMTYLEWRLGLLLLILIATSFFLIGQMMGNVETMKNYLSSLEQMTAEATEYVRGMQVVKLFNANLDTFKNFKTSITDYSNWSLNYSFSARKPFILNQLVLNSLGLVLVFIAYPIIETNRNSTLFLMKSIFCLLLSAKITIFLIKILYMGKNASLAFEAVNRLDELFLPYEKNREKSEKNAPLTSFDIEFDHVTFSYTQEEPVIDRLSFKIPEKSVTAIVGVSGSGKSTIAKLASKMYENYTGEISIGGQSLHQIEEETVMRTISYVFQETKLFNRTLAENLKMANPTATDAQLFQALKDSECLEIIEKLPQGLETVIGSSGVHLSGGEQQRLAICRVFLKNDPILILDEVTASIDPENEYKIQRALQRLLKQKTVILIAHKLSLIEHADQILVLQKGKLVEKGTHQKLVAANGVYKNMQDLYVQTKQWNLKGETL